MSTLEDLEQIQAEYCRKIFIHYAFVYKERKSNTHDYTDLLKSKLIKILVDTDICTDLEIIFDKSIWAPEPIYKDEHRNNQISSLLGVKIPETNYQNIVRFMYHLRNDRYYRSITLDLRKDYHESITFDLRKDYHESISRGEYYGGEG
jgi:hypothetical protein